MRALRLKGQSNLPSHVACKWQATVKPRPLHSKATQSSKGAMPDDSRGKTPMCSLKVPHIPHISLTANSKSQLEVGCCEWNTHSQVLHSTASPNSLCELLGGEKPQSVGQLGHGWSMSVQQLKGKYLDLVLSEKRSLREIMCNCLNQTKDKLLLSKRCNAHVVSGNCLFGFSKMHYPLPFKKKKKLQHFPFQECDLTS